MSAAYYRLPRDERWLTEGDSPDQIGGHGTEVAQVAYCLSARVRENYAIKAQDSRSRPEPQSSGMGPQGSAGAAVRARSIAR
jgi:hypothetical protein